MKLKIKYKYLTNKIILLDTAQHKVINKLSKKIDIFSNLLSLLHISITQTTTESLKHNLADYYKKSDKKLFQLINYLKKIEKDNSQFKSSIAAKHYSLVCSLIAETTIDILYLADYHINNVYYDITNDEIQSLMKLKFYTNNTN